jgi:hypothetical protein
MVHMVIVMDTFIRQRRHVIRCKCSVTDTTLEKMADIRSEALTGALQNFSWDSEYSISYSAC